MGEERTVVVANLFLVLLLSPLPVCLAFLSLHMSECLLLVCFFCVVSLNNHVLAGGRVVY